MSVRSSMLSFGPLDSSNRDADLMKTLEEMVSRIPTNPPAFVTISPRDTGAGLLHHFYEREPLEL